MAVAYFTVSTIVVTFIYLAAAIIRQLITKEVDINYSDGLDILMMIDLVGGWLTAIWAVFMR